MKRIFDFTVSLLMIIILMPLLLAISLAILIDAGHPIIFRQYRVGKDNKLFYIYKFRTMKNGTGNKAKNKMDESDICITRSGRFLRKTSLDELPQLLNILRGEMSFVGPRPLIPEEKEIRQMRAEYGVFAVRPGMTGLAQVMGRDVLSDEEKAGYDKEYVENQSFINDMKIIRKTFSVVLTRKNIIEGSEKVNRR